MKILLNVEAGRKAEVKPDVDAMEKFHSPENQLLQLIKRAQYSKKFNAFSFSSVDFSCH